MLGLVSVLGTCVEVVGVSVDVVGVHESVEDGVDPSAGVEAVLCVVHGGGAAAVLCVSSVSVSGFNVVAVSWISAVAVSCSGDAVMSVQVVGGVEQSVIWMVGISRTGTPPKLDPVALPSLAEI